MSARPTARPSDFDIRYRRLLDDVAEVAQLAIGEGRAGQAAALLEAEHHLAAARDLAEAHRRGQPCFPETAAERREGESHGD
ncbi:MAG: hypothetical protein IMZ66_02735 [Planctomycetes bacterium]|nr:hypothetical protein [Planctomycetota bacterium]